MWSGTRMWLVVLVTIVAVLQVPSMATAGDCAFQDVNNNGILDPGDIVVPDAAWIGGTPFVSNHPFVVPVGCEITVVSALLPLQGVKVTATKITVLGKIESLPPGGKGLVLIADPSAVPSPGLGNGDLVVGNGIDTATIRSGGVNNLPAGTVAVAQKSVALIGTGDCTFRRAEISGNSPLQNTKVGILCTGDMTFQNSKITGSKVNIQSLAGAINASGGGTPAPISLADLCDNPATNLTGHGNNNHISDAADFPCTLNFTGLNNIQFLDPQSLANACVSPLSPPGGANNFLAFNDPLIMIAGAGKGNDLNVQGASIVGRYRLILAAEDGNILAQNAKIDHGEQQGLLPPGGAKTWLFADPVSIVRTPPDHEDFAGPCAGTVNITNACFRSTNPVNVCAASIVGAPAPSPCLQNPADFTPVSGATF